MSGALDFALTMLSQSLENTPLCSPPRGGVTGHPIASIVLPTDR